MFSGSVFRHPLRLLAALALAATLGACDDEPAPLIPIEGTGDVQGTLFLDVDENGVFDPAAGDVALSGVALWVTTRDQAGVLLTDTVFTNAQGQFSFSGLPLGTHQIVFDPTTVPEGASICQGVLPVSVSRNVPTYVEVAGRPACLITIAQAQALPLNEFVIVRGVVTSSPSQQENNWTIIEDATGGIMLFASGLVGQGIEVGDLIEVGGTLSTFDDRLQLTGVELREHIPDFGELTPEVQTIAVLKAAGATTHPLQNRLFTIRGAELTTGFTAGGSRNATITDATGDMIIRVEDNVSAGNGAAILTTLGLEVGKCYDITGILGTFRGTAQVFPRSASDFTEVACS